MVIVGAGECGARAALELREAGYAGPVTLVGAEIHLPYERPPLSKDAMTEEEAQPRTVLDETRLAELGVRHIAGNAAETIDRQARILRLADGSVLPYEKLLLATGAIPRRLPGLSGDNVAYLRTYDDALAIRQRLLPEARIAIVGGGFIGLELAAAARKRGAEATLIEAQPRILMRGAPQDIAAIVDEAHRANGVNLLCGVNIASVEADDAIRITLEDGRLVDADLLIVGIGAAPVSALAEAAGLAIDNGIAVDSALQTSDPHIYAAGDCCSFPLTVYGGRRVRLESWRNAQEQGALAARNMLGAAETHAAVPWFWSDQYDLGLHVAGLADEGAATVRRDLGDGAVILFHLAADGRLVAASGIGPGNTVARDIRLAEMLIAKGARPAPDDLAAPEIKLKKLLAT
ncbi:FAD-dependent oxidoreductase [Escherichia coli]|nr:FAD-dependent oxidoreductase [Escherichia coli]